MAAVPPVCYVTTTGKKSRQPHRIEIWFVEIGSSVYLLSGNGEHADWVRHISADGRVLLELPGTPASTYDASVGPFDNDAEVRGQMNARYYGASSQLTEWARDSLVVRLDPSARVSSTAEL
jgi:deazaflavin-dependent oxidoreductase (nitroreductase family)